MHSALEVGLDSAKITGRSLSCAIGSDDFARESFGLAGHADEHGGLERFDRGKQIGARRVVVGVMQFVFVKLRRGP